MATLPKIYVIGTGGLAKETAQLISEINERKPTWSFEGYISSRSEDLGVALPYGKVVNADDKLIEQDFDFSAVIAVGNPALRKRIYHRYSQSQRVTFPNLVHPDVKVDGNSVCLGIGNVICRGVQITCDISIGNFNLLNLNVTVGHDAKIGSFNVVNPGVNISGGVELCEEILVGTGSQILEGRKIVSGAVIGAGALVSKDVNLCGIWVGIPAKLINKT